MGGPMSPFPKWWIRDAAAQVGLTKVEMADAWTQVGLPAVEGRGGWTQVGVTAVEMGDGTAAGEVARGGRAGWEDGSHLFPVETADRTTGTSSPATCPAPLRARILSNGVRS